MFHVTISALDVSPTIFSMETFFGANLKVIWKANIVEFLD